MNEAYCSGEGSTSFIEISDVWDKRLDLNYLFSLCPECHAAITREMEGEKKYR